MATGIFPRSVVAHEFKGYLVLIAKAPMPLFIGDGIPTKMFFSQSLVAPTHLVKGFGLAPQLVLVHKGAQQGLAQQVGHVGRLAPLVVKEIHTKSRGDAGIKLSNIVVGPRQDAAKATTLKQANAAILE